MELVDAQGPLRHFVQRQRADEEAGRHDRPGIDAATHCHAGELHRNEYPDPARHQDKPRVDHVVAHQLLQHRWQQCHGGEHDHADGQHEAHGDREVAVEKQRTVEQAVFCGAQMDDRHPGSGDEQEGPEPDFVAVVPVERLPAIQQHLEACQSHTEQDEAGEIELALHRFAGGELGYQDGEAEDADRQVDVEHPAPVGLFRQPATQHRAEDRADHDPHAP